MKKKKTGILPGFRVLQRTKKDPIKITGRLESSKIRLEITACPDDWKTLKYLYSSKKEALLRDLQRFIFTANQLKTNKKKHRQNYVNLIKTQAALLHGYISRGLKLEAYCEPLVESLKRIIPPEQLKSFMISKGKSKSHYDTIGITKHIVESAYSHWIKYKIIKNFDYILPDDFEITGSVYSYLGYDNFNITYIQGGKEKLSKEDITFNAVFVSKILPYSNKNNSASIEFLQDIAEVALVIMNCTKSSKPLSLQKGIIKAAFPSFSTSLKN